MDLLEFTQAIHEMSVADIREVAAEIGGHQTSAADDIAWWQATLTIDKVLKHDRRCRTAAVAPSTASRAVLAIVEHSGGGAPDSQMILVARAPRAVPRGLVARPHAAP